MYRVSPHALFGACLTALGQMRARIVRHDVEQGLIVAEVGGGLFAPASQMTLRIAQAGAARARLTVEQPARPRGGDPRALTTLLEAVERLLAPL